MTVAVSREATAGIESRQQINYWRAQHARAAERASRWQQRARQAEHRYCGRPFSPEQMEAIRQLIACHPQWNRAKLSRAVCELLPWWRADGRSKEMSCRVAMLRMARDGLIRLPPPQKGNGNGRRRPRLTSASDPQAAVTWPASALGPLRLELVDRCRGSSLWNELIERYHYLGWQPLPGAQMRYLAYHGDQLLAALGCGAAAWALAPRDRWIGWTAAQRQRKLDLVVNNARFLILPWVRSPNLASRLLGQVNKRLPSDWRDRYGYSPVLLETFVVQGRHRGTCCRAANWIHVGQTQGRGKMDRYTRRLLPIKDVLLPPLPQFSSPTIRRRLRPLRPGRPALRAGRVH